MQRKSLATFRKEDKLQLDMISYSYSICLNANSEVFLYENNPFWLLEAFDKKYGKCMDLLEFRDCLVVQFERWLFFYTEKPEF